MKRNRDILMNVSSVLRAGIPYPGVPYPGFALAVACLSFVLVRGDLVGGDGAGSDAPEAPDRTEKQATTDSASQSAAESPVRDVAERAGRTVSSPRQVVVLRSGNRLEGVVVKRTDGTVFLDVGFTILDLPVTEIREIEEDTRAASAARSGAGSKGDASSGERSNGRGSRRIESDSIFFCADLKRGTIEEKAREVSESVVRVLCLGKSGSGFIINGDAGYVVTNFHVIEGEQDISVVLYVRDGASPSDSDRQHAAPPESAEADGTGGESGLPATDTAQREARRIARGEAADSGQGRGIRKLKLEAVKIVAMNAFFDLALLQIQDSKGVRLKTSYLGDFARVNVGDPVFAIGSPLGLERTVTEGIVSNRNRALSGMLSIQTTAPINPGNSGGPLFNDRGEVIGVTSSKIVGTDSLGFAIPVHYVKDFLRNRDSFAFDKDHPNTGVRYLAPPPKRASVPRDPSLDPPEGKQTPSLSGTPAGGASKTEKRERPAPREGRL